MQKSIKIRRATERDASAINKVIVEWLDRDIPRRKSIKRAIRNDELLVAEHQGQAIGFVHCALHEDIIDGGLNAFITGFYVQPEFRNKRIGSRLLEAAIRDALNKGAIGIETSTASPEARRLYERHRFKQFMGKWTMGEVFLELDVEGYRQNTRIRRTFRTRNSDAR